MVCTLPSTQPNLNSEMSIQIFTYVDLIFFKRNGPSNFKIVTVAVVGVGSSDGGVVNAIGAKIHFGHKLVQSVLNSATRTTGTFKKLKYSAPERSRLATGDK